MSIIARQSTARTVMVGPVLDADGVAVTDSVVGDFKISKNGGAPAVLNGSATLTHRHTGHYSLALTATDLNTVGQAEITCDDTVNACPVKVITVIEEAVYDALFAASAAGYHAPGAAVASVSGSVGSVTGAVGSVTGAVGSVTGNVGGNVVGSVGSVTGHTPQTGDSFARIGATGSGLTSLASQASVNTIDGIVDAILIDTAEIGAAGAGLTALATQASVNTVDTVVDAIQAKTDNLPTDPADQSLIVAATDAIMGRLGAPSGASVSADIATRATPAQVNAEVLDVLNVDTHAQPGQEAPPATTTLATMLRYLFKFLRNVNEVDKTDGEHRVLADDGTTVDHVATISDDGDLFTRGEWGAGP